ncbi:MAG: cytochrome c1 [Rhodospirillaceae bacterium]|mgnify:FL=1|jgi:ubiquinol-cytochrome c reductase cytochrome c1 subunit|nr:cytochrome c1 [Rhodospirillaceae bacterium]MBT3926201.1 cytochrome c1 [Rhodospirillaceae bacterium]MBT4425973.1 cytochrome c1 [Rhodospirillaceae bacterium]MBT5039138.1 cytochrome c1 [Rhodospirillaceae bacterium]MBT5674559.1 cytochrome c1 [Rhodospirillaceae bacterium]
MRAQLFAIAATLGLVFAGIGNAVAAGSAAEPPDHEWQHTGVFGTFDRGELQRGFQVFQEVCASCHSLDFIAFRNLLDIGFDVDQIKAIAAEYEVEDGPDNEGEMFMRTAKGSDYFPAPFANPQAARASNGGAFPPDLSVIVKARDGGLNYLYGILTGYEEEAPEGFELAEGMNYNHYFPGHQIAMPEPLYEEAVEYADGTEPTLEQLAHDVSVFLAWTAEPELEIRKKTGLKVLIFIAIFTALIYIIKRRVWAKLH